MTPEEIGQRFVAQFGDGVVTEVSYDAATVTVPTQVLNVRNAVSISAGANHSLAATGDGTAWAWGLNSSGQLGNGYCLRLRRH